MSTNEEPNYLLEFLQHEIVSYSGIAALVFGLFILASGFGGVAIIIAIILWAAAMGILALFVPSSPLFQDSINRKIKQRHNKAIRKALFDKLDLRYTEILHYQKRYNEMCSELETLQNLAGTNSCSISSRDLERLEDSLTDFLRLINAVQVIQRRINQSDDSIKKRIESVSRQLENPDLKTIDRKQLETSLDSLEKTLYRNTTLPVRLETTRSQMETMYQAFKELHYQVVTDPGNVSNVSFVRTGSYSPHGS